METIDNLLEQQKSIAEDKKDLLRQLRVKKKFKTVLEHKLSINAEKHKVNEEAINKYLESK